MCNGRHNMYAYHISQPTGIIMSDNSDDGESAAGGRLAHLLSLIVSSFLASFPLCRRGDDVAGIKLWR